MLALIRGVCLCMVTFSFSASAVVSEDSMLFQTGRRWFSGSSKFIANEISGSFFSPLSDLPLAIGLGLSFLDLKKQDLSLLDHNLIVDQAWGYECCLAIKFFLAKSFLYLPLSPYLIYIHDVYSDYEIVGRAKIGSTKSKANTDGYKLNLGFDIPLNKKNYISLAYSLGSQSIKFKYDRNIKIAQGKTFGSADNLSGSLASQAFLFGLNMSV